MYEFILFLTKTNVFSFSGSVPTFHGLQEDILSKLADVLEEVNTLFQSLRHLQQKACPHISIQSFYL